MVFNTSDKQTSETSTIQTGGNPMTTSFPAGTELIDVLQLDGSAATSTITVGAAGALTVQVASRGAKIYVPRATWSRCRRLARWPPSPSATSARTTARRRCSATCRSRWPTASSWCWSARRAAASRRCCAASPGSRRSTRGAHRHRRRDVIDGRAARPRHRDGVPELRALPAPDRAREPRLRAQDAQDAARRRSRAASPRPRAMLGLDALLDRQPAPALGRPAPARRDGARDRAPAEGRSSSTSRCRTSTRRCARRCASS